MSDLDGRSKATRQLILLIVHIPAKNHIGGLEAACNVSNVVDDWLNDLVRPEVRMLIPEDSIDLSVFGYRIDREGKPVGLSLLQQHRDANTPICFKELRGASLSESHDIIDWNSGGDTGPGTVFDLTVDLVTAWCGRNPPRRLPIIVHVTYGTIDERDSINKLIGSKVLSLCVDRTVSFIHYVVGSPGGDFAFTPASKNDWLDGIANKCSRGQLADVVLSSSATMAICREPGGGVTRRMRESHLLLRCLLEDILPYEDTSLLLGEDPTHEQRILDREHKMVLHDSEQRHHEWAILGESEGPEEQVKARELYAQREAEFQELYARALHSQELNAKSLDVVSDDNVQFTAYCPRRVQPEKHYSLLIFAHLEELKPNADADMPDPKKEVERQAKLLLGQISKYRTSTQDSSRSVPREGELTFLLELDGFTSNPSQQTLLWEESVHRVEFRIKAMASLLGTTVRGRVSIFLGDILLTDIVLRIDVSDSIDDEVSQSRTGARPYRKIFASYSRRDSAIVNQFERYATGLGDRYLRDLVDLRSGEQWNESLKEMIREADVFQLFWSTNSMKSQFVQEEIEFALSLGRPNFVRPTYWEAPFPEEPPRLPSEQLKSTHFQFIGSLAESINEEPVDNDKSRLSRHKKSSPNAKSVATKGDDEPRPKSPLEQLNAKSVATKGDDEPRPKSPLEQLKAKSVAAKGDDKPRPKSPLELMKAKSVATKSDDKLRPKSPLEQMKGKSVSAKGDDKPRPKSKVHPKSAQSRLSRVQKPRVQVEYEVEVSDETSRPTSSTAHIGLSEESQNNLSSEDILAKAVCLLIFLMTLAMIVYALSRI